MTDPTTAREAPAITSLRLFQRAMDATEGDETLDEVVDNCITALERGGIPELRRCVEESEADVYGEEDHQ